MEQEITLFFGILNWGLGHATRSIPIIKELKKRNIKILLGSDGDAMLFLKQEFPELEIIEMPSYQVEYPYENMTLNMALQLPGFLKAIRKEHLLLDNLILKYNLSVVISDNRYGLYSKKIPCIFITHQVNILIKNRLLGIMINQLNLFFLKKFNQIWVPDFNSGQQLSGKLGQNSNLKDIIFIGPLSRLEKPEKIIKYDIVAVLSGPEPQRSYFEKKLIEHLSKLKLNSVLVQGKPGKDILQSRYNENLIIYSFADAETLSGLIKGAELFISRSGYSTIMDLARIGTKAVLLIPTPGQTEQEYLAEYLHKQGIAQIQQQSELNVFRAWEERKKSLPLFYEKYENLLTDSVDNFLRSISNKQK